ncbi:MAG: FMN-binding protein [Planctomycetota bacterium]
MSPSPAGFERPSEPSSVRLVLTLGLAGLFSGVAIVGVFEGTLARITENKARALRAAVFEVVPGSTRMEGLLWSDGGLVRPARGDTREPALFAAYGAGEGFLGYALVGEGPGFQDTIRLIYGYDPARRRIVGMRVLDSRETPGLGDRIYKDEDFVGAFGDLAVEPEVLLVKKGKRTAANEIDAITGATISSKAVVKIINSANSKWLERLPPPGTEPAWGGREEGGE